MHLKVAAMGQRMPSWVNDGWQEYARRFPKTPGLELIELPLEKRSRNSTPAQAVEKEGQRLLGAIPDGGRDVYFMIGGPDGLSKNCLQRAELSWSLGLLTLPHPLVRVILAEQLYRGFTILSNHPYHRA